MEPIFTKPDLSRYSQRSFPPYRYLPFQAGSTLPHPRTDPNGHSYSDEEDYLPNFSPDDWRTCEPYLYGIDLFNHSYWWEAHESLETVWLAAGQKSTLCGKFVQGLIQLAGAQLKRFIDEPRGALSLTNSAIEKLSLVEGVYLGVEAGALIAEAGRCLREDCGEFPRIELQFQNGTIPRSKTSNPIH
jgi:predicted metal-dependent hydrolase